MPRKLGPHYMMGGGGDTERWLIEGKPTVAKFHLDFGVALKARPETLLIGRMQDDNLLDGQGFDMNRMCLRERRDPMATAQWYVRVVLEDAIRLNPHIQAWEGPNEQVFEYEKEAEAKSTILATANQSKRIQVMLWYAKFLYEFARQMHLRGKRAVIGSWSVANPPKALNLWPHYTMALRAVQDWGALLSRHEYGFLNGEDSLRYRWDNAEFAKLGYPNLPVVITECGADWTGDCAPWRRKFGTIDAYWDQLLKPYALAMEEDAYCLGATVFSVGNGATDGWKPYDVNGTGLVNKVIELANQPSTPPPPPPPPVEPGKTHRVTALGLNVRQHPWTGEVEPAKLGLLPQNCLVTVFGTSKPSWLQFGWASLTNDSDRWVSMKYLEAL